MDKYYYVIDKCNRRSFYLYEMLKKENYLVSDFKNNDIVIPKDTIPVYVFAPSKRIEDSDMPFIQKGSYVFAGKMDEALIKPNCINFVPLMSDELYVYYNSVITAEGAMQIAMTSLDKAIYDSYIMVLGYGRLGKAVARIFKDCAKGVGVATYNLVEYHSAGTHYITYIDNSFIKNMAAYDVIINTIPAPILDIQAIKHVRVNGLFIDLASVGCIEAGALNKIHFNYMPALQLPDKVAPYTAATELKKSILRALP